jgi:voltage-gated potassium channel
MKEKLYSILNVKDDSSTLSKTYNVLNIVFTLVSLIPLMFKNQTDTLFNIEIVAVGFFVLDYFLRWFTTDIHRPHMSTMKAYLTYPFTLFSLIDLLAILPFVTILNQSLRLFRLFRFARSLRIFRAVRIFRDSTGVSVLVRTIKKQKQSLIIVGGLTVAYILVAAIFVFNIETETFQNFLEAVVWATSSLTTATYGDAYPTSTVGQVFSIISYLVGVAIIALPSSIITAGYIDEMEKVEEIENEDDLDNDPVEDANRESES